MSAMVTVSAGGTARSRSIILAALALAAVWLLVPHSLRSKAAGAILSILGLGPRGKPRRGITESQQEQPKLTAAKKHDLALPHATITAAGPASSSANALTRKSSYTVVVPNTAPWGRDLPLTLKVSSEDYEKAAATQPKTSEPMLAGISVADLLVRARTSAGASVASTNTIATSSGVGPASNTAAAQSHRHAETAGTGFGLLYELEPFSRGWTVLQRTDDVTISTLDVVGLELPFVRGDGIIYGAWSVQEVLSVIRNGAARKIWDPRFDMSETLEFLTPDDFLLYSVQKGTFPVSARDFVTVSSLGWISPTLVINATMSVRDEKGYEEGTQGRVRGNLLLAGWILERGDYGVRATYIVNVDPKGTVPSQIIKMVQVQTPMCIANVARYLDTKGVPPFIFRDARYAPTSDIFLQREQLVDGIVHLEYIVRKPPTKLDSSVKRGRIAVALPSPSFVLGAEITMNTVVHGATAFVGAARKIPEAELADTVSSSVIHAVEFWIKETTTTNVDIYVEIQIEMRSNGTLVFKGAKLT